jgi:hypothetical protein
VELLGEGGRDRDVRVQAAAAGLETLAPASSDRRLASTQPAEPAPTIT